METGRVYSDFDAIRYDAFKNKIKTQLVIKKKV